MSLFWDSIVSDYAVVSSIFIVLWWLMHGFCNTGFEAIGVEVI